MRMIIHEQHHTCFTCGESFDIEKSKYCPTCGWKRCPSCDGCYCRLGTEAQLAVDAIWDTFCKYCNPCKRRDEHSLPNMFRVYRYIDVRDGKALSEYLSGITGGHDMTSYAGELISKGRDKVTKREIQQKLSSLGVRYW